MAVTVVASPHSATAESSENSPNSRPLHRIKAVRCQQGVTLRTAARHLGCDVRQTRQQEQPGTDIRLSELYNWQAALDVPVVDLLEEPGPPLSHPVRQRASMVRLMKTALAIQQQSTTPAISRLAENLVQQLVELMPELAGVGAWHQVGQRRNLDECGRIVEQSIPDTFLCHNALDNLD